MIDLLLRIGVSNLCLSFALAIVAWVMQIFGKRPVVAHLLWLIVLAKLVTPPVLTLPVIPVPGLSAPAAQTLTDHARPDTMAAVDLDASMRPDTGEPGTALLSTVWKVGLVLLWSLGSTCVLVRSLSRIHRFNRLLRNASEAAPPPLQDVATEIAQCLGLPAAPTIYITSARLSPMVWWIGGSVRIVIPAELTRQMGAGQLRLILAHELAHVRRRDHAVRWLEWLACVCFWWNPVAWWARRNLRANEELCCDAMVVSSLKPRPRIYADALFTAIERLACPMLCPPAVASEINSGRFLERRFKMIVSETPHRDSPRWSQACLLMCAMLVLPLGLAYAQDYEAVEKRLGRAVSEGELSLEHAAAMMRALRRSAGEDEKGDGDQVKAIGARLRAAGARLKAAVAESTMTEEEAWSKWLAIKARTIKGAVRTGRISEEAAGALWRETEKAELAEKLKAAVAKGELTEAEARSKWAERNDEGDHGAEMEGHLNRLGVSDEKIDAIRKLLKEEGLTHDQIEPALGGMLRLMHGMRSEGEDFELDPRLRRYFRKEVGLDASQITVLQGIARRIAHGGKQRGEDERREGLAGHFKRMGVSGKELGRIERALAEHGVKPGQMGGVLGGMVRVMHELRSEGEDFELDAGLRDYLGKRVGLTDGQIDHVQRLARRVLDSLRESDRKR